MVSDSESATARRVFWASPKKFNLIGRQISRTEKNVAFFVFSKYNLGMVRLKYISRTGLDNFELSIFHSKNRFYSRFQNEYVRAVASRFSRVPPVDVSALASQALRDVKAQSDKLKNEVVIQRNLQKLDNSTKGVLQNCGVQKSFFSRDSITRARNKVLNLALHNAGKEIKFATLTYDDAHLPDSFENALLSAQNAMKRWQYRLDCACGGKRDERHTLKYLLIPELGEKKRRIHWHAIIIAPFIENSDFARNIWKNGYCQIKSIRSPNGQKVARCVASYVCKYITKNCEIFAGRKRIYYASHTWVSDCDKAFLTPKQAFSLRKWLADKVEKNYISAPKVFCANYDNTPTPDFTEKDVYSMLTDNHYFDVMPADYVCLSFAFPHSVSKDLFYFLKFHHFDLFKSDFMRISAQEKRERATIRQYVDALEKCMKCEDAIEPLSDEISLLFPNIPRDYVQKCLEEAYFLGGKNISFNNLPLINRFPDCFDLPNQKCDPDLRACACQTLLDDLPALERQDRASKYLYERGLSWKQVCDFFGLLAG